MSESKSTQHRFHLFLSWPRSLMGQTVTGGARLVGAGLLAAIGLVHLVLAPQYYPAAAYIGILFYVTVVGAWLTAAAIVAGLRGAWLLGGVIAAGALVALVLSSTVGLPGFVDSFSAPWAMLSLLLEGLFVVFYIGLALLRRNAFLAPATSDGTAGLPRR